MRPSLLSAVALSIVALYAMPATAQDDTAEVEFEDQTIMNGMVVVASVTLPEGGFVVIHDDRLNQGDAAGSVVGVSDFLDAGTHEDVEVTVDLTDMDDTDNGDDNDTDDDNGDSDEVTLIAMPHMDTNDNEEYDFEESNGADDGPYTDGGSAVTAEAMVTMEEDDDGFGDGGDGLDDPGDDVGGDGGEDDGVDGDEDAPGFGVVALLALLGGVAILARRR